MNGMKQYKGIFISKGSNLYELLQKDQKVKENVDAVKKQFDTTFTNFQTMYSKDDDWKWFMSRHNKVIHELQTQAQ